MNNHLIKGRDTMIHLIFGAAAAGSLKYALRKGNHKIIEFPIDFSVGPFTNIHQQSGIDNYFSWVKSAYHPVWGFYKEDQATCSQSLQQVEEIEDGEQVTIWTSENASEQIGLRISCFLLKDKEVELRLINTSDAMEDYTKLEDVQIHIRHTGECVPEQLAHFYKHSTCSISEKMKSNYVKGGERLVSSEGVVRSWINGEIVEERESRDDRFILESAIRLHSEMPEQEFINATSLVGEVIGHSKQTISDSWIEYRIRQLIHSNYLAYEGDLQSMGMYKIKVKNQFD
ncbi:DUF1835 domain-containing protein [Jeotgalibacillus proteolyticus]|uniref:DUF1835 domain-containing protein n=1 Tax=Jeotgalibacillus proteolyticus TaxID=2082395 RepID=A0A2S5G9D7_9BACL|nr:DUF1835 domain-containing protein [Jeotgalibacillus proteolyticus]PPA69534.1 hypothetical protein C4B60_13375 [Jeotgalibacillus proteolyticus]